MDQKTFEYMDERVAKYKKLEKRANALTDSINLLRKDNIETICASQKYRIFIPKEIREKATTKLIVLLAEKLELIVKEMEEI